MKNLRSLYHAAIMRHASNPVGFQLNIPTTHRHEEYNAQCGDRIEIRLAVTGEQIEAAAFDGEACQICLASASMLCDQLPGKDMATFNQWHQQLTDSLNSGEDHVQEDFAPLLGVRPFPTRRRCATLPWEAAAKAVQK